MKKLILLLTVTLPILFAHAEVKVGDQFKALKNLSLKEFQFSPEKGRHYLKLAIKTGDVLTVTEVKELGQCPCSDKKKFGQVCAVSINDDKQDHKIGKAKKLENTKVFIRL